MVSGVDKIIYGTIFIHNMGHIELMNADIYGPSKITDDNIRLIIRTYFNPQVEETSNGILLRFVPNRGNVLPEALVWFHRGKKGFSRKPLSQNVWVMVDCDLKSLHDILNKFFLLSEGDYNLTRQTLSTIAYEVISEWGRKSPE